MNQQDNNGNNQRDTNNSAGRKPDYVAYNVQDSKDGKGYWNKVGAAWSHKDGQGYDIALDSMPVNGRITLRQMREERMQGFEQQRQNQGQGHNQEQTHQQTHGQTRDRSR